MYDKTLFYQCAFVYIIVNISHCSVMEHIKYRVSMLLWLFHVNFIAYDTCIRRQFEVIFYLLFRRSYFVLRYPSVLYSCQI